MLRLVKATDGWREVYDHVACPACGTHWRPGSGAFKPGWLACACQGGTGHRKLACQGCGAEVYEPPHRGQYGPTADYGAISAHRSN